MTKLNVVNEPESNSVVVNLGTWVVSVMRLEDGTVAVNVDNEKKDEHLVYTLGEPEDNDDDVPDADDDE